MQYCQIQSGGAACPAMAQCVANTTLNYPYSIGNNASLAAAESYTSIGGALVFTQQPFTAVLFPVLTGVAGALMLVNNSALATVQLPVLTRVGGALAIDSNSSTGNAALQSVSMPQLRTAGSVFIGNSLGHNNSVLTYVGLAALSRVAGAFTVSFNSALWFLAVPQLTSIGPLTIQNNAILSTIYMPSLAKVAGPEQLCYNAAGS